MEFGNLFVFLVIAISFTYVNAESIYGCGGFVEASSGLIKARKASDSKLDYSHITIELLTLDGLVRDRTQCAPNGYYFIPVYDKGSFIIKVKGPNGWSFDPDNVPVTVDQNGCNANADINFRFTGFMISGRVQGAVGGKSCSMKDGGPSDVKVDLLSPSDDLITSVFTSTAGKYSFSNVSPGKYKLSASHPNLEIKVRGTPEVDLGFGNVEIDDVFAVSGYDLQGFVVAQGNPILGVHVYLYSDDVSEVSCLQGVGSAPREQSALCHAVTDADGKFIFHSLPCGSYELLPYYKGENTIFDVSPPSMAVSVEHQHLVVSQKFQVTGFSVGGRVVDSDGAGVDGANIKVDGQMRVNTDSQGYYKLDQVTSKHYSIVAEKEHYKFTVLENFQVLPNMAYIKEIKAVAYDICGGVRLLDGNSKTKVALTHGPENAKPQVKITDHNGNFCFQVPAGEYRLSALAVDSSSSVLFSPPYVDIKADRPLLNIEFSQAQVDIRGTVHCKEYCGDSTSLTLVRLSSKMDKKKTIFLSEGSSDFTFTKIFPGKYSLEIKHVPSPQSSEDNWCWEQSAVELDVGSEDMEGIVFTQKGYWITIVSSHDTKASIEQPDSSSVDLFIKRGSQNICVENPGEYEIHFVDSCVFFGSSSVKFSTTSFALLQPVNLIGKKYLIKGSIHVDSGLLQDSEIIVVDIYDQSNVNIDAVNANFASNEINQSGKAVYEYTKWADLGEKLTFVPRHDQEKKILFYPRERKVSVTVDGCQPAVPTFSGRRGLYLDGSVSPALSGVSIKIIADEASNTALLRKGDLALMAETVEDGSFTAGPLYDDSTYIIEASKPGYHVKKLGPNHFTCQKLGQIVVKISDGRESEEELLFPSVLLSLSGDDGYRNNSASGPGGAFIFDNLFPGNFYLRPLLKEYSFSPPTVAIELGSGDSKSVHFHATRVAYSVMGTVTLLTGQAKEGVYVEARSESRGYYEEAKTDSTGNFRLRGLLPDTTYAIKAVSKDDIGVVPIERASPSLISVKIGNEDTKGVNFIVFEKPEGTILSGHLEGTGLESIQNYLSIEIKGPGDTSLIEAALPVPLSNYFQIRDLPKSKHVVQLRSSLPSTTHVFQSEAVEVDLEKDPQIHVGPIRFSVEERHHKQELTAAPVFPLVVGLAVVLLFISMPRLKDLYQAGIELATSAAASKKETKKTTVVRRRTY